MARGDKIGAHEVEHSGAWAEPGSCCRRNDQFQHPVGAAQHAAGLAGERCHHPRSADLRPELPGKGSALRKEVTLRLDLQPVLVADNDGGAIGNGDAHGFHPQIFAPASLWDAICSLVCRVSTSCLDGLIGCAQSQSLFSRGSVAHPAIETAIKSSVAVSLYVMPDLS